MHHDWPVKNAFVDLPIRLKGNSKRIFRKSLSLLGVPLQGYQHCFPEVTNQIMSVTQANH